MEKFTKWKNKNKLTDMENRNSKRDPDEKSTQDK